MSDHMQRLADYLVGAGVLDRGDPWLDGLHAVPRHLFVPSRAWMDPQDDRDAALIDRDADPDAWWDAVYSNAAIITQRGDGRADVADVTAPPTSSTSSPHVVFEFLRLLGLEQHHRVLEIGTGTGWTAALLSYFTDGNASTIDIDPAVTQQAAKTLTLAGHCPEIITGDGAVGHKPGAPYDRVHVTCGVREVPYAWVEQTRPGGSIVLPWMPPHGQWGERLRLDVLDDGSAVGTFHGLCRYMMMRSQRPGRWPPYPGDSVQSVSRVDPREIWVALDAGFGLALAAAAPHIVITGGGWEEAEDWSAWVMRLRDLQGPGWAVAAVPPGEDTEVTQHQERRLWTHLEGAFMEWLRAGRPGRDQYRMIVTPGGQDVWLP